MKSCKRHTFDICKSEINQIMLNTILDNLVYFLLYQTSSTNCKVYDLYKNIAILDYDILLLPSVFFSLHLYPCGEHHISLFSCHPTYFLNIIYRINKNNYTDMIYFRVLYECENFEHIVKNYHIVCALHFFIFCP